MNFYVRNGHTFLHMFFCLCLSVYIILLQTNLCHKEKNSMCYLHKFLFFYPSQVFCRRFGVPLIDGGTMRLPALIGASVSTILCFSVPAPCFFVYSTMLLSFSTMNLRVSSMLLCFSTMLLCFSTVLLCFSTMLHRFSTMLLRYFPLP